MSATVTVTVTCDHLGCQAFIDARDSGKARRIARRAGWAIAIKRGDLFRDFCPEHRDNRSVYG